jgi:hypothetical protein
MDIIRPTALRLGIGLALALVGSASAQKSYPSWGIPTATGSHTALGMLTAR